MILSVGKQIALLVVQEGEGPVSLLVRDPSGDTEVDITASIFQNKTKQTVFSTDEHAVYMAEVKISEDGPSRVTI